MTAGSGSSKPKILFHTTKLDEGGAERITRSITQALAKKGVNVSLAVLKTEGPSLADWPQDLVPLIDLGIQNPVKSVFALRRLYNEVKPDLVVTALHQPSSAAILARGLSGWKPKIVVTLHSNMAQEARDGTSRNRRIMPHVTKRLYPKADGIIAVARESADAAAQVLGLPQNRFRVIYNPVVSPAIFDRVKEFGPYRPLAEFDGPVIVGVGRLDAQKDFATAIRAVAVARQKGLGDFRYVIVGEGVEQANLQQLAIDLNLKDQIWFAGYQKNPYGCMARARLLLMTSRLEGLPTVLIEALAVGTPVIFTDCPSGPREILQPPRFGVCPPVGDVDAIAEAVIEELQKPKIAPPPESWAPYTEEASTEGYIAYLSELLSRPII